MAAPETTKSVGSGLLILGLALVALWLVLTVTRAVVGGLVHVALVVGLILLAVYAFQQFSGHRHIRT